VESGAPMGDEHTAVSWCDGDNLQIDTIVSEEGIQRYSANCRMLKAAIKANNRKMLLDLMRRVTMGFVL